jgi:hypothetical protein
MNERCKVLRGGTETRAQCHVLHHKCHVKQSGTEAERSPSEASHYGIPVKDTALTFQMALHGAFQTSVFFSYIFSLQILHICHEEGDSMFYRKVCHPLLDYV